MLLLDTETGGTALFLLVWSNIITRLIEGYWLFKLEILVFTVDSFVSCGNEKEET